MPYSSNNIPPAILSFVKKKSSGEGGDVRYGDDSEFLIPSSGSSFNLAGDSERLMSKSASRLSNHSRGSSKSNRSRTSRSGTSSGGSSNGGSGRKHHRRRRSGSGGSGHEYHHRTDSGDSGKEINKRRSSPRQRQQPHDLDSSYPPFGRKSSSFSMASASSLDRTSELAASTAGSGGGGGVTERGSSYFSSRKTDSASEQNEDGYLVGCDSDGNLPPGALTPIAGSFHSESIHSEPSAENDRSKNTWETDRSISAQSMRRSSSSNPDIGRSTSIDTSHAGKSYNSQKSQMTAKSNRSRKSSSSRLRGKLRRQEKRRECVRRWRRRRLLGKMLLTCIYSLIFAYTLLVTLGPLMLHFGDPTDWCPYYNDDTLLDYVIYKDDGYTLHIDQLQRKEAAKEDIKGTEINLLRRTSRDIHFKPNDGDDNNNQNDDGEQPESKYENPDYDDSPCYGLTRIPSLFYLTLEECDLSRRMAASVLLGGLIGHERRAADRPAGIRTMALVSLGSCFFTISSQQAFRDSPMTWDSSRVTAAIPSGVGFLGAGLIWKGSLGDGRGGEVHQVHGITTAASVWLAAAVGVGAGGALYAVSAYSTALIILVLRFGPRLYLQSDRGFEDDEEEEEEDEDEESESDDHEKHENVRKDRILDRTTRDGGIQMHHMGPPTNDTTTLRNNEAARYGATDVEQNTVGAMLREHQRRQVERMKQMNVGGNSSGGETRFLSRLTNLLPGRGGRQQPFNPYQEITSDREVMRLMKRKKSMGKMSSRPSFCT